MKDELKAHQATFTAIQKLTKEIIMKNINLRLCRVASRWNSYRNKKNDYWQSYEYTEMRRKRGEENSKNKDT